MSRNPFGPEVPKPVSGCPECTRLVNRRASFRQEHNLTRVTDINVLLWRHHQQQHAGPVSV